MAIEDLDLEFEEEDLEEKSDALEVDVDLSFSASNESKSKAGNKPAGKPVSNISAQDETNPNIQLPPKQTRPQARPPQRKPTQQSPEKVRAQSPGAKIQNIAEQRAKAQNQPQPHPKPQVQSQVQARAQSQQVPTVEASFSEDYGHELQHLRDEIAELKNQIGAIQSQADVKVAVAEAKSEFVIDYVTDAKLADHQVNQVLQRIHKRVPGLKNEVLSIKKTMTEFVEKTTKKKK